MSIEVRISNPERADTVVPSNLKRLEDLIRDELRFASAPSGMTLDARRESIRLIARTKTAIAITKDTTSASVVTDAEVASAADQQSYEGYVLAFESDRCLGSVDTGGTNWHPIETGCAFPVDAEGEEGGNSSSETAADIPAFYISVYAKEDESALVKTCSYCLPVEPDFEPAGAALLFASTRGQVLNVRAPKATTGGLVALPEGIENAHFLSWRGGSCCGNACFEIDYVGDPPLVRDYLWFAPDDDVQRDIPCVEPPRQDACSALRRPRLPRAARFADSANVAAFATTSLQDFEHRGARIAAAAATASGAAARILRLQRFWLQFDASTNPGLLNEAGPTAEQREGIAEIYAVGAYLEASYLDRARRVAADQSSRDGTPPKGAAAKRLLRIADFTKARLRADVDADGPLSESEFRDAFELFAGGQLTVVDAQGAPNGLNYFCFAELAIRRLEIEHDPFWWEHLPLLTRSAEIFVNAYHMKGGQRRTCAYGIPFNPTGARGYSESQRDGLTAAWSGASEDDMVQHYGELVAASIADEFEWKVRERKSALVSRLRDQD